MPFILLLVLILASSKGYRPIVNSLISANASLNIGDIIGRTALMLGKLFTF